ncbi:hypothetical protein [uncultured Desulfobacter sp.]|uniref:hypothetical protein n=1 Tax=uncultured Desulfobacter sp. TaxID=240139 RepID=UPI002AABCF38|nr:hypothetical protein [uncultured Desulfobacter sp.]
MNTEDTSNQTALTTIDWYIPTNHLNLSYMMAFGLVLPVSGFKNRYYTDPLSLFPGNILCFADKIPGTAIAMAVEEEPHLLPCVIKINLQNLKGPVHTIDSAGQVHGVPDFSQGIKDFQAAVVFPGPVPATWIEAVYFQSKKEVAAFKESLQDYSNVDPGIVCLRTNKTLFKDKKNKEKSDSVSMFGTQESFPWPNAQKSLNTIPPRPDCDIAGACGGIMGLLYAMADHGAVQAAAFQGAMADEDSLPKHPGDISFIYPFWAWTSRDSSRTYNTMFWGMVKNIAQASSAETAKNRALDYLNQMIATQLEVFANEKAKPALESLVQDLTNITQNRCDLTLSQLLEKHPKPFSRAVILFFLRESSQQLLDFENENFNASDRVGAAILFGAREGWMGLSPHLKSSSQLRQAIFFRMAVLARTDIPADLASAPAPPVLWRNLFILDQDSNQEWTDELEQAAVFLAKHQNWDCIHTHVLLGHGEYTLKATRSGLELILDGLEKRIIHKIDRSKFVQHLDQALSKGKFSDRIQWEIKKILGLK